MTAKCLVVGQQVMDGVSECLAHVTGDAVRVLPKLYIWSSVWIPLCTIGSACVYKSRRHTTPVGTEGCLILETVPQVELCIDSDRSRRLYGYNGRNKPIDNFVHSLAILWVNVVIRTT